MPEERSAKKNHEVEHAFVTWGRFFAVLGPIVGLLLLWGTYVQGRFDTFQDKFDKLNEQMATVSKQNTELSSEVKRLSDLIETREEVWSLRFESLQTQLSQALATKPNESLKPE